MARLLILAVVLVSVSAATAQLSCYTCAKDNANCRAEPFEFPADKITGDSCGDADKSCMTKRYEITDGIDHVQVERACAGKKPDGCDYTTEDGGKTFVSTCFCNTPFCNFHTTSGYPPRKCYKCDSHNVASGGANCLANPLTATGGVTIDTCKMGETCMTVRSREAGGEEFVVRGCGQRHIDGCTFHNLAGDVVQSRCHYNKELGNDKVTSVRSPINCYTCGAGNHEEECKAEPFVATETLLTGHCDPGQACLIKRQRDKDGKETVSRGCSPTTSTPATPCVYSPTNAATGITESNCYCSREKCNNGTSTVTDPAGNGASSAVASLSLLVLPVLFL